MLCLKQRCLGPVLLHQRLLFGFVFLGLGLLFFCEFLHLMSFGIDELLPLVGQLSLVNFFLLLQLITHLSLHLAQF